MFTKLPSEKSEAPDTESLLRDDQSDVLQSSRTTRWTARPCIYFHSIAVILYSSITLCLYLWSVQLSTTATNSKSSIIYCKHERIPFTFANSRLMITRLARQPLHKQQLNMRDKSSCTMWQIVESTEDLRAQNKTRRGKNCCDVCRALHILDT